jgi:hypothetical protein
VARSASLEASRSRVYLKQYSCSPVTGFLATVASRDLPQNLTPASGRQNHTTSPYAHVPFVVSTSASTASHRAFVTIASRPSYRVRRAELNQ